MNLHTMVRLPLRRKVCRSLIVGGLLAALLAPLDARASTTYCRSDPVVTFVGPGLLSVVTAIDLSATIGDSLSDINQVAYTVHAPVGSHLVSVVNTDGLIGLKEKVVFVADDTSGHYDTYTTAYTGQSGLAVTATTLVTSLSALGTYSATGYSSQAVHIAISSLL